MQHTHALPAALAALAAFAGAAHAQHGLSGNGSTVAVVDSTVGAADVPTAPGLFARVSVGRGFVAEGLKVGEPLPRGLAGLVGIEPALGATPPILFSVDPALGHADGGQGVELFGFRLADGALPAGVGFGLEPATGLVVKGPGHLTAITPEGRSSLADLTTGAPIEGNPLGAVVVSVTNANGTAVLPAGYRYTPSLEGVGAAVLNGTATVRAHGAPGEVSILSFGVTTPGFGLPLANVSGALELLPFVMLQSTPVLPGPPSVATHLLPLPDDTGLAGLQIPLQSALAGPSGIAFTDVHRLLLVLP